jgi:hypothetical protein
MGKNYEQIVKTILISNGFGVYITYFNPLDDYEWKKCRGKGVDSTIKIGKYRIDIEIKYNDANYPIRLKWLAMSGIRRFRKCPEADCYNLRVILVSRPQNWKTASELAEYYRTSVLGIDGLLKLMTELVTSGGESVNEYQSIDYHTNDRITSNLLNKSMYKIETFSQFFPCYQIFPKISTSWEENLSEYQLGGHNFREDAG